MAIVTTSQNLTAVSYSAGEIIEIRNGATLTIDSTPTVRPGTIQCLTSGEMKIENASTTTPIVVELEDMNRDFRFEGNGVLEIRGAPIVLGTSDGTQQTWDFSSLYSGILTDVTYVEVETAAGSDDFMPWHLVDVTPRYQGMFGAGAYGSPDETAFDSLQEVLFYNSDTRVLTSGDGTNGKLIPNGCKVRIPNILLTNQDWQLDTTLIHAVRSYGTPTGGNFTITLINRRTGTTIGTTSAIAYNAAATVIRDAVIAVLGPGTETSSGGPLPSSVVLTLAGSYASTPIAMVVTSSVTGGTNPLIFATESSSSNMAVVDLNPSGTMFASWCMFSSKVHVNNSSFSRIEADHVGFGGSSFRCQNSNGGVILDCVSFKQHPVVGSGAMELTNVSGTTSINKFVVTTGANNANLISTLPNLTRCDDVRVMTYAPRTGSPQRTIEFITLPNIPILRPRVIGGALRCANLTGNTVVGYTHADTAGVQTSANTAYACELANCIDMIFSDTGKAGDAAPRLALFYTDSACANIRAIGGAYDMTDHGAGLVVHNGAGFIAQNLELANQRTGTQSFDAPTTFACTAMTGRKVFVGGGQAVPPTIDSNQDGVYDLVGCELNRIVPNNVSVENYVGGNFMDYGMTPTTGHVTFGPFGSGAGMVVTGSSYTDQKGSIFLPSDGDTAEMTIQFAMHGITAFQNVSPRFLGECSCPTSLANAARLLNDGGVTGGTFTVSAYDSTGTLIGTTSALARNASTSTVQTAIRLLSGLGSATVSGSLSTGYIITATGTGVYRFVGDGTSLTGGTKAGTMDSYARYTLTQENEFYPGIQFACRVPGTSWPAYADLTGANLSGAIAALSDYDEGGSGLEMRIKITGTGDAEYRRLQQVSLRTDIDPDAWEVTDASITFNGPNPTDVIRIRRLSDAGSDPSVNLYSFTGGGLHNLNVGANYGEEVYFVREDSSGTVLMRSLPTTTHLGFGDQGEINLFYGDEVQLAQVSTLASLDALIQARLDVAVSTRLAAADYTAPDNAAIGAEVWANANGISVKNTTGLIPAIV